MIQHSALGASSAKRWMNCPSSLRIIAAAVSAGFRSPSSSDALEGSTAHWAGEKALESWIHYDGAWCNLDPIIGTVCPETGLVVTQDMNDHVMDYVTYCLDLSGDNVIDGKIEYRVSLAFIHPAMFGTCDFAVYDPFREHLDVVDFKYGMNAVEAENNEQGIYYAMGAAVGLDVKTVTIHIHQPRAWHPDGPVRTFTLTIEELRQWFFTFRRAAYATENLDAPAVTGDWCRLCDGKLMCPVNVKRTLEVSRMIIDMEPLAVPTPEQLAERMTLFLEALPLIKKHKDAADLAAYRMSNDGGRSVPGFKLVGKKANREWRNEQEIIATAEMFGIDPYEPGKLKSPSKLKKAFGSVDNSVIDVLSFKPDNGKTLVPLKDKRPAVVSNLHERYAHINIINKGNK